MPDVRSAVRCDSGRADSTKAVSRDHRLFKRRRRVQMLGFFPFSTTGVIGLALLLAQAFYYKLLILGPELLLFWSATGAVILFLLASVFFFNYPRLFIKLDRKNARFDQQSRSSNAHK